MSLRGGRWSVLLVLPLLGLAVALIWWRGPDWRVVHDAFTVVRWPWVAAAIGFNLLSVFARALCWETTIMQSIPKPHPKFRLIFSAFSVGLFANAVLPARAGELARVAVLRRRLPGHPKGTTATLIGSVFAHRMFDLFPAVTLVIWVLFAAKIPAWAITAIAIVLAVGILLFLGAWGSAKIQHRDALDEFGTVQLMLTRAREGLAVMRAPLPAASAATFQFAGWLLQLFAVWATMHAFHIYKPLAAAGLVLVLINVATIFPLWPGNVGLVQIAVATPLVNYGVAYGRGVAFGIGLQAIEASVGVGVGLIFLAREGVSYATLKRIEEPDQQDTGELAAVEEPERARAGIPG